MGTMNAEKLRELLLERPHTTEETPFGPEHLVYKIAGLKLFAILSPDEHPPRVNLKCDPDRALDLRDRHEAILPGYHMNKKHWNTVLLDGSVPKKLLAEMVADSWALVFATLPAKERKRLGEG
jgi:predicted DNA-binding protein (MmcQ/YjbR family)